MEKPLHWDIFCRVIDNFGDIGVCWRLSQDLAVRGHQVRLWLDDASALQWMAPEGHAQVDVIPWNSGSDPTAKTPPWPTDVIVEGFGCGPDHEFLSALESTLLTNSAQAAEPKRPKPVWINLEYLSAESYVERSHRLPSHSLAYPLLGANKFFFYPGFTSATGGLIREPWLEHVQSNQHDPLLDLVLDDTPQSGEPLATHHTVRVSLFCYDNAPLGLLWRQLLALCNCADTPVVHLLVTAGKSTVAIRDWLQPDNRESDTPLRVAVALAMSQGRLKITYLPWLAQMQYDALLRQCDLNYVRGEDSLVRALWARRPFVWHIYPQEGEHHQVKLQAFIERLELPEDWVRCITDWNRADSGTQAQQDGPLQAPDLRAWNSAAVKIASGLSAQPDLVSQLIQFVGEKR